MIISRPTGLYSSILPKGPDDPTSVVYTISYDEPPRSTLAFTHIPTGVEMRPRPERPLDPSIRRVNRGQLVFTTKDNKPTKVQEGNSLFYVGQILGFDQVVAQDIITVNSAIDTEHDQYYVNGDDIGLDAESMNAVSQGAEEAQKVILADLQVLQKQQDDLQVVIVTQQKIINEANRVIEGLDVILATSPDNEPIKAAKAKAQQALETAQATSDAAVTELNTLPTLIKEKHDQLRALATLID